MKKREIIIKKDYALVPLTQGKFSIIDIEDIDIVNDYTWYYLKRKHNQGYAITFCNINGKKIIIYQHRLIMDVSN